jgi:hypothetical protein
MFRTHLSDSCLGFLFPAEGLGFMRVADFYSTLATGKRVSSVPARIGVCSRHQGPVGPWCRVARRRLGDKASRLAT